MWRHLNVTCWVNWSRSFCRVNGASSLAGRKWMHCRLFCSLSFCPCFDTRLFFKKKSSSHFTPRSVSPAVWDMGEYALFGERGSLSFKCHIWKRETTQFTVTPWFHPRGQKYVYFLCQAVMIFGCCGIRQISPRGFPGFFLAKVDTSCY